MSRRMATSVQRILVVADLNGVAAQGAVEVLLLGAAPGQDPHSVDFCARVPKSISALKFKALIGGFHEVFKSPSSTSGRLEMRSLAKFWPRTCLRTMPPAREPISVPPKKAGDGLANGPKSALAYLLALSAKPRPAPPQRSSTHRQSATEHSSTKAGGCESVVVLHCRGIPRSKFHGQGCGQAIAVPTTAVDHQRGDVVVAAPPLARQKTSRLH